MRLTWQVRKVPIALLRGKVLAFLGLCGLLALTIPMGAQAADVAVETSTSLYAKIDASRVTIRNRASVDGQVVGQAALGQTFAMIGSGYNGWIKIETSQGEGYIPETRATIIEKTREKVDENVILRKNVVEYALQFVGNPYVWGGTDPNRGADCSGFTSYVMRHAAGISLAHNSTSQSRAGRSVSYEEAQAGDLIFYGGNGYINHVALYMGNDRVVHASTEKTGIKVSAAQYRRPVKIISVLD